MSENRKTGPGIRTKPHSIRDRAMTTNDAAKRVAEKARFAQRRAKAQTDESKPEGDAVCTIEDAFRKKRMATRRTSLRRNRAEPTRKCNRTAPGRREKPDRRQRGPVPRIQMCMGMKHRYPVPSKMNLLPT